MASSSDITNFSLVITPPASQQGSARLTISFQLSASFGASAVPWAMISAAGGSMAGGADIQTTAFAYDADTNTYTLDYAMPASAADGVYSLRQLDLRDKSGSLVSFTASYFDLQGMVVADTLANPFADNDAPVVSSFTFSQPVKDEQDGAWLVSASYEANDASGIRSVDAYLSLRSSDALWSAKAFHYETLTTAGTKSTFSFRLPSYLKSGDYSLLYAVTDNANNTNWYQTATDLAFTHIDNPGQDIAPPVAKAFSVSGAFVADTAGNLRPVLHVSGAVDFGISGNSSTNLLVYNPDYTPQNNHYVDAFIQPDAAGAFSVDVNLASPSPDGRYALLLECIDGAGNITWLIGDSLADSAPAGSTLLSSLGLTGEVFVYAPGDGYDPAQGITLQSTRQDAILFDGAGNDTLVGDAGSNDIVASGGADHLSGGAGNDSLQGGDGNDYLYAGTGNDTVNAGTGNDLIVGGDGAGDDRYSGGSGSDTIKYTSATAAITINLRAGTATSVNGGDAARIGNDRLSSIENVIASRYDDVIVGSSVANRLRGMDGNDRMVGLDGNDRLEGAAGVDVLSGDLGNDRLSGGLGKDRLTGGSGKDAFIFDTVPSSRDTITDFSAAEGDKIQLSKAVFKGFAYTGTLHAEDFYAAAGATKAHDATDRLIYNTTTGVLYYDADGLGGVAAVQVALLGASAHPALVYGDLQIIA